jgi:hypothetical protein
MIQPELFSDSHQAFEHFRKVTSITHFLKEKELLPPRWPWVLLLVAWLATIWIVHFFIMLPPLYAYWPFSRVIGFWLSSLLFGTLVLIPFVGICVFVDSRWIIRRLKNRGIVVIGWNWFGKEVQRLMLQDFTEYLVDRGYYNLEALGQLIDNSRDEIEARWRPIAVMLTTITLAVALLLAYYQPVFSSLLQIYVKSGSDINLLAKLSIVGLLVMLLLGLIYIPILRLM